VIGFFALWEIGVRDGLDLGLSGRLAVWHFHELGYKMIL
jgi:hypothetical protein